MVRAVADLFLAEHAGQDPSELTLSYAPEDPSIEGR
jgi:hypothetical protein